MSETYRAFKIKQNWDKESQWSVERGDKNLVGGWQTVGVFYGVEAKKRAERDAEFLNKCSRQLKK